MTINRTKCSSFQLSAYLADTTKGKSFSFLFIVCCQQCNPTTLVSCSLMPASLQPHVYKSDPGSFVSPPDATHAVLVTLS